MGQVEELMNQIMELKSTSNSLQRQARKCKKHMKSEKLKLKKAIKKGNMDAARISDEKFMRKGKERINYLWLLSKLDAVVARFDTQVKMIMIVKSQKMPETMGQFEKKSVNMEVNSLMQQAACDYGLEVSVGLPQHVGHAVETKNNDKVEEEDLIRRFDKLKAR